MTESTISLLIVDDHLVVRQGFVVMLNAYPHIQLVGEAKNGQEAVARCGELHPNVVLMDMMMPVMDGKTAIREIKQKYPDIKCIALTSFSDDKTLVREAIEAGAVAYLFKNVSVDELAHAIQGAYDGRSIMSSQVLEMLMETTRKERTSPNFNLSERELKVLELMVKGKSNADIAQELVVSLSTVKFHVSNVLEKLGANNRTEAVYIANEYNLV